jgi:hypothetical protein
VAKLPLFILSLAGCSFGSASISPMSHFAFPNSNVIPIGEAKGSHTRLCGLLIINWGSPDGDDQQIAIEEALEETGGDILINVRTDSQLFMIPYLFALCITSVRGTAAKMEIGRQQLDAFTTPGQPPPAAAPPPAVAPPPAIAAPPAPRPVPGGCKTDAECKGDRICEAGVCKWK